jgi:hypothetical protein
VHSKWSAVSRREDGTNREGGRPVVVSDRHKHRAGACVSARVDGAREEAGVDVAVSSPLAPRLRRASSSRPSETERGRARTEPPRLRRVSSIKKAPPPHRGNRRWAGVVYVQWRACAVCVLIACMCGHVRTTRGKSERLGRLPKAGGWDGREKGERRKRSSQRHGWSVKSRFARVRRSGGLSTYLARASHARACKPYRTRVR